MYIGAAPRKRPRIGAPWAGVSLLLLPALMPAGLQAQPTGTSVRGRVLTEEAGRPVPAVEVRFRDGPTALTDREGEYRVAGVAEGWYDVAVVTAACHEALGRVQVPGSGDWVTNLSLPETMAREHARMLPGAGEGLLLTAADIQALPAATLADALRRELPELAIGTPGQPGRTARVQGRNRATVTGSTTPLFYVDGIRMGTDPRVLWDIAPGDVAWVEILRGPSAAWRYGTDASGGVIRVFTAGGGAEAGGPGLPARCGPVSWVQGGPR